jgi:hypothetical protein
MKETAPVILRRRAAARATAASTPSPDS